MAFRKTKILCTIGPSTAGVDNLIKLANAGMDAARLNFSHGSHEVHLQTIADIRKAEEVTGKPIAIIQDLQGPKIRTGKVKNGGVPLVDGEELIITVEDIEMGDSTRVSTSYKSLIKEVSPGNTILLDDGYLILTVIRVDSINIYTRIVKGGILKDNKGIITPGVSSTAPSLSQKDIEDLKFGLDAGVDMVALSFVRSERDVIELRATMKIFGRTVPVISKIERYEGVEDIVDIINESDAIMVARGDLGLEMPAEQVPVLQKEIIKKCNHYGKPVIIATQMLESMIKNPRPTRAEASDVANAVLDGSDCVMLSGETSVGDYPFDAVEYMRKIILAVEEQYFTQFTVNDNHFAASQISEALGSAACSISNKIGAKAIIPVTYSGFTALDIAKYRPSEPVIAFTDSIDVLRFLCIVRGAMGHLISKSVTKNEITDIIDYTIKEYDFIQAGDYIVIVAGLSARSIVPTNMIKVHKIV